ncbi:MAG: hypothetical protein GPJ54_17130 [Candidatus Heimdallarchaeota archaeon]|nr:hypothetical protein [Candidatus Heimdallarchaeota archaeon]
MDFDKYFFVSLNKSKDYIPKSEEEENRRQLSHQLFLSDLNKEGLLLAAGPFAEGGGILFFDTEMISESELTNRLSEDPHTKVGSHNFEIKTWFVPKHVVSFTVKEYSKIYFPVE